MITRENVNLRDPHGLRVFGHRVFVCPDCGHGIDPHGTDPGGICGVGDEHANPCPCLMTPNGIVCALEDDQP